MRVAVKLFGHLAGACGPGPFSFAVESGPEIFKALHSQIDGFRDHLLAHADSSFRVVIDGRVVTADDLMTLHLPGDGEIECRIVPTVRGESGKEIAQTVIGAVLVVAGIFTGGATLPLGVMTLAGGVAGIMTRDGTAAVLSPTPDKPVGLNRRKTWFDNPTTDLAVQGTPIPIHYGRVVVEGLPVSVKLSVVNDIG